MVSLVSVLLQVVVLLSPQLQVLHQLREVLERGVVRVCVREGGIVSVDVERHRQQLRHDAVVSYQRRQAAVHFQETLTVHITLLLSDCLTYCHTDWAANVYNNIKYTRKLKMKTHLYLISLLQLDNDVVCDAQRMECLGNSD